MKALQKEKILSVELEKACNVAEDESLKILSLFLKSETPLLELAKTYEFDFH